MTDVKVHLADTDETRRVDPILLPFTYIYLTARNSFLVATTSSLGLVSSFRKRRASLKPKINWSHCCVLLANG